MSDGHLNMPPVFHWPSTPGAGYTVISTCLNLELLPLLSWLIYRPCFVMPHKHVMRQKLFVKSHKDKTLMKDKRIIKNILLNEKPSVTEDYFQTFQTSILKCTCCQLSWQVPLLSEHPQDPVPADCFCVHPPRLQDGRSISHQHLPTGHLLRPLSNWATADGGRSDGSDNYQLGTIHHHTYHSIQSYTTLTINRAG